MVPVGALEQHGGHLPLATDALLVEHVCVRAADRARCDAVVAPALWTGLSPHHVRLGPTVTLLPELLIQLLTGIVRGLRGWFPNVVVVNGHGGNRGWVGAFSLQEQCPSLSYWELLSSDELTELFPADLGSIGHAGQAETSAMLAMSPSLVSERADSFEPITRAADLLLLPEMGASGVLGDPAAARADLGERFLDLVARRLAAYLDSTHQKEVRP